MTNRGDVSKSLYFISKDFFNDGSDNSKPTFTKYLPETPKIYIVNDLEYNIASEISNLENFIDTTLDLLNKSKNNINVYNELIKLTTELQNHEFLDQLKQKNVYVVKNYRNKKL